ncbi:PIN domain-containing protein [Candidatus Woesearchaeota archaeon]|nr:PIN domain-containing protein [Candidatus Woesearchaeota archaeon]
MKIVVDANIIIACLLGSRGKIAIVASQNHKFYVPIIIIAEIIKYKEHICDEMEITPDEFDRNLEALLIFIEVVDYAAYEDYITKAEHAIKRRDIKDVEYIACALAVNADFIWSDDKDFTSQNLLNVKTTEQFIKERK